MRTNGAVIEAEIEWFDRVLDRRLRHHAAREDEDLLASMPPPRLPRSAIPYAQGVREAGLSDAERLVLILAMLPLLRPRALDSLLIQNEAIQRRFTEFGGLDGAAHGFRPTRETALFLLAGEDMDRRLHAADLFAPEAPLQALRILDIGEEAGEPAPWTRLAPTRRWLAKLTGAAAQPHGSGFPAQLLETPYRLGDLVVADTVRDELEDLLAWTRNERMLMDDWGLRKHLKPGYRALFHGPPGTGKTMAAAVLGKELEVPVYRVDLSRVVSKWVGETEKNLGALFDEAANGDMLLFFDEADALFGKRGDTQSANDRHANQQIAYLLQRVEECPGVVILASNLKGNIDAAFARRFQATIYFAMPDAAARLKLWQALFAHAGVPDRPEIALDPIARDYALAGGEMVNVLRRYCVGALRVPIDEASAEPRLRAAILHEAASQGRHLG
jgi:hypothetical protein